MRITFVSRKFGNVERNSHCDVLHITPVRVARLVLDCNGVFAIKAYGRHKSGAGFQKDHREKIDLVRACDEERWRTHTEESDEGRYTREKEERTAENKMERRMPTRFAKYWTESGRGDGQGDVEKKDHQSYRRPYMMGKARGKVSK